MLAELDLTSADHGVGLIPLVGTGTVDIGDPQSAVTRFERVTQTNPSSPAGWLGLARAASQCADSALAHAAFDRSRELDPQPWRPDVAQADSIRLAGKLRGAMFASEASEAQRLLTRALSLQPTDAQSRRHLVNSYITRADFRSAATTAWPKGPGLPEPDETASVVASVLSGHPSLNTVLWTASVHARELYRGAFVSAYAVKRSLAAHLVAHPPDSDAAFIEIHTHARALAYVGELEAAAKYAHDAVRFWHSPAERQATVKFCADIEAQQGDVRSLHQFCSAHLEPYEPSQETSFAKRIDGRSVAIVGPAPLDMDADLSAFDTIITTKQLARWTRSTCCSLISYYSDASAALEATTIAALQERGDLSVPVVRPSLLGVLPQITELDGRLRVMQTEDATTFMSTRFGIQRILYDVVRYRPSDLALFGSDLFVGQNSYLPGYADEVERVFAPSGYEVARSMSVHDYAADFDYVSRLHAAGLLHVTPELEQILQLSGHDYLSMLQPGSDARTDAADSIRHSAKNEGPQEHQ